jgi:glycosyltransferase involved in cell wall biosynthesis
MSIRVLHVLPSGTGARFFTGLARTFDRARFDFHFLTLEASDGENLEMKKLGVTTFGLEARGLLRAGVRLRRFVEAHRYDLLHLHLFPSLAAFGVARFLGAKGPLVVASHHYGREAFLYPGNWIAQWMERACCRRLDHVIAVSQDVADYLRDEIGIPSERVSRIPYGFDLEELAPPASLAESRNGSLVVGSVARLHWTKGQEYLLRAASRLKHEDRIHLRLLLLGAGPEETRLRALVRELAIESEVTFLGHRPDPVPYYREMDVFCHPSLQRGYEQVTVEAMALGKAVVATPVGIAREVLRDGENGVVVPEKDAGALRAALLRLWRDPSLRRTLGRKAASDVRRLVPTSEEMTRRYEETYLRLLESRP